LLYFVPMPKYVEAKEHIVIERFPTKIRAHLGGYLHSSQLLVNYSQLDRFARIADVEGEISISNRGDSDRVYEYPSLDSEMVITQDQKDPKDEEPQKRRMLQDRVFEGKFSQLTANTDGWDLILFNQKILNKYRDKKIVVTPEIAAEELNRILFYRLSQIAILEKLSWIRIESYAVLDPKILLGFKLFSIYSLADTLLSVGEGKFFFASLQLMLNIALNISVYSMQDPDLKQSRKNIARYPYSFYEIIMPYAEIEKVTAALAMLWYGGELIKTDEKAKKEKENRLDLLKRRK
jgi:hypothetical protein